MTHTVIVFAAGPGGAYPPPFPHGALVVAADGGAAHARALGIDVDVAIGDFDSLSEAGLAALERAGVRIDRHPADKDSTDLALALDFALGLGAERVIVVGSASGRLDHSLGQLLLLAADAYRDLEIDARLGRATVHVIRRRRTLAGVFGELVSLFALGERATGIVTTGLLYPLHGETLEPGSTHGVSNVFTAEEAIVSLEDGVLLAVRPGSR